MCDAEWCPVLFAQQVRNLRLKLGEVEGFLERRIRAHLLRRDQNIFHPSISSGPGNGNDLQP